ncbi:SigE family RNA polymerase sigma factor [Spirilliplanes yamanashiensis]|uniref:RNA polymerase sigma24 factor n=1 Tax=Spirilliplanes yamanashiensis TaxID=42233 RepID=A0A8J3Y555_9ACTN|nr:SigE family RNA polymerase sigma factor [Spirilliplanes yamanashiensis]MDP9819239.1 RNA polymerase sigma-70 factor (sigma-E family) [Spirilliplanes yamanashiensis]GIJ01938.1 RNA polymerase sigma24 factor [Spirilliplanes yamanashiensis]
MTTTPDVSAPADRSAGAAPGPRRRAGWLRARQDERAAADREFTAFAESAAPRLRRTAFLMCRDWHLAQDLTQIALAKMYVSWRRIWRTANLEAYSRRVLMNAVFDQKRRRSDTEVVLAEVPERGPGAAAADPELRVTLVDALATLPVRDRAIVVLRYWEDHSVETVADLLGVSTAVVKTQSSRSLSRLRDLLGPDLVPR